MLIFSFLYLTFLNDVYNFNHPQQQQYKHVLWMFLWERKTHLCTTFSTVQFPFIKHSSLFLELHGVTSLLFRPL